MNNLNQQEKPIYVLPQVIKRALIPKIIIFFLLGIIFYLGILLNVSLIGFKPSTASLVRLVALTILLVIIIVGILLAVKRSRQKYLFYKNRISFGKKDIIYQNITNISPKQNFLDKMFKTVTINLGSEFHLKHIHQSLNIDNYLKQLMSYTRKN
jgi:hypothetical protein